MMSGKGKLLGKIAHAQPQQTTSRRSTTDSMKSEESEESPGSSPSHRNGVAPADNQLKGEVIGEHCLVCNDRCFIRPYKENLTEPEYKLSFELREMFYEVYQIPMDQDFIQKKSVKSELPLCYSCSFHLGQLKNLHERLKELHRDFIKFQETVAFSIVDIVAGAVPKRPLLDFTKLKPDTLNIFMSKSERTTLQNMIYNDWHTKIPSFPEYESNNIPTINPIVDAPPGKPRVTGLVLNPPKPNPTLYTRPIVSKSVVERNGNGKPGKTTVISVTTQEEDDDNLPPSPSTSSNGNGKRIKLDPAMMAAAKPENGHQNEEVIEGDGNDVDVEYEYYDQDQKLYRGDVNEDIVGDGDEDQMIGVEGDEDIQHFATRGHFMDANGGGEWAEGEEEEEYNEYDQLYEDAGFNDNNEEGGEGMQR